MHIINVQKLTKIYKLGQTHTNLLSERIGNKVHELFQNFRNFSANENKTDKYRKNNRLENSIYALKDVSFDVEQGEVIGIIGRNGAGKSTLLKILSNITTPTSGRVELYGRVASLLEVGTGFHPELTGRENIFLNGVILGMSKKEIRNKFDEILFFAELEQFIDTPVKRYSSGMFLKLAFAVAAHLDPEILIVDEVLAVGDYEFQQKCIGKMENIAQEGRTVLFVSHNMNTVNRLCDKAILIENGSLIQIGEVKNIIDSYLNINTKFTKFCKHLTNTGSVTIEKVKVYDKNGGENGVINFEDSFIIEITYRTQLYQPDFIIALRITDSRGNDIFTTWNTDYMKNWKDMNQRSCCLRCKIPGLFLRPGNYTATAMAHEYLYGKVKNMDTALYPFEISDVGFDFNKGRIGIITPLLEWYS